MAKPISKKLEKRVRRGAKAARKSLDRLTPNGGPSAGKVAGIAAAGVAGVAGAAAAIHYFRRGSDGVAELHVQPDGEQWIIIAEGADDPIDRFGTKEEAVDAARDAAADAAPSELVIHRLDGSVMRSHGYAT
jgi:hypothetical protein